MQRDTTYRSAELLNFCRFVYIFKFDPHTDELPENVTVAPEDIMMVVYTTLRAQLVEVLEKKCHGIN